MVFDHATVPGLREGASAQGHDGRSPPLDPSGVLANDLGLDAAEFSFASAVEDGGDRRLFGRFDFIVRIEKTPAHPVRQQAADGRFAGPHEADQVDAGSTFELDIHAL
jgi:hypothetical protein